MREAEKLAGTVPQSGKPRSDLEGQEKCSWGTLLVVSVFPLQQEAGGWKQGASEAETPRSRTGEPRIPPPFR